MKEFMHVSHILNQLIRIPSLSGDAEACQKSIRKGKTILTTQKVVSKIIKTADRSILIWGELDLKKTKWLINSHLDVVPGSPKQFEPEIRKGKIWGRGAADTKSSCAILLSNSRDWNLLAIEKHITFMLVTDEEIGGTSTKEILPSIPNLQGAIFLEPTGEKMVIQAKGIIQAKITSTGQSSHGSRPWEGKNALEMIASDLTIFRFHHPNPIQETKDTTFNFSLMSSGTAINQVPAEAILWCDIRFNPLDNPEQIIADLTREFHHCKVETVKLESTVSCPKTSILCKTFINSLKHVSINPLPGFEHGSSDARHCTALNIPTLVFGPKGKNIHADNEWVSLKSLEKVEQTLNHWIKNI